MGEFQINSDFADEIRSSDGVTARVKEVGEAILARAKANASAHPGIGDRRKGEWARSIVGSLRRNKKGVSHYHISTDYDAALSIEFGTSDTPARRDLGRAIRAVGP